MKPIIFERFDDSFKLNVDVFKKILKDRIPFHIPVIFCVNFAHVFSIITFPIGGKIRIQILKHPLSIEMYHIKIKKLSV